MADNKFETWHNKIQKHTKDIHDLLNDTEKPISRYFNSSIMVTAPEIHQDLKDLIDKLFNIANYIGGNIFRILGEHVGNSLINYLNTIYSNLINLSNATNNQVTIISSINQNCNNLRPIVIQIISLVLFYSVDEAKLQNTYNEIDKLKEQTKKLLDQLEPENKKNAQHILIEESAKLQKEFKNFVNTEIGDKKFFRRFPTETELWLIFSLAIIGGSLIFFYCQFKDLTELQNLNISTVFLFFLIRLPIVSLIVFSLHFTVSKYNAKIRRIRQYKNKEIIAGSMPAVLNFFNHQSDRKMTEEQVQEYVKNALSQMLENTENKTSHKKESDDEGLDVLLKKLENYKSIFEKFKTFFK